MNIMLWPIGNIE